MFDLDRGWNTALRLNDQWSEQRKAVDIYRCYDTNPSLSVMSDALYKLKQHIFHVSDECARKANTYDVVGIDTLTVLGEAAKRQVIGPTGVQSAPKQLSQQQWGLALIEVENILYMIRSLPIPAFVIAHTLAEIVDEKTEIKPACIGAKLPDNLPNYFDEVWYYKTEAAAGNVTNYVVQSNMSPSIVARSRGQLPNGTQQNLGMEKLMELVGYKFEERPVEAVAATAEVAK